MMIKSKKVVLLSLLAVLLVVLGACANKKKHSLQIKKPRM